MTIKFECDVDIACPRDRVFALLDDVSQAPRWLASCSAMEKLTPGPNAIGTEIRYVYKDATHTSIMMGSITERIPNESFSFEYSDNLVEAAAIFQLTETGTGTHVHHEIELIPKTFFVRLMSPIIRRQLAEQTGVAMEKFRQLLESPAG